MSHFLTSYRIFCLSILCLYLDIDGTALRDTQVREKQDFHRQIQRESCLQFIVVIVFMVGFLILMLTHEDIQHVYTLENVVKKTMTKPYGPHSLNFKDVKDVVEIWKWMDYGLLPAIVRHNDPVCDNIIISLPLFSSQNFI